MSSKLSSVDSQPEKIVHPVIRVFDCHIARLDSDGHLQFLLLKRAEGKIYAGDWRMVGGKIKPNEPAWAACLREVREETALQPDRFWSVPFVNRFYEWRHDRINDIPVFLLLTRDTQPKLDEEHTSHRWCTVDEAAHRLPWPGQRDGLHAAAALYEERRLWRHLEISLPTPGND